MYYSRFFNEASEETIAKVVREYARILRGFGEEWMDSVHNSEVIEFFAKCYLLIGDELGDWEDDDEYLIFEGDLQEYLGI